jgi:hypothetical protein
MQGKIYNTRIWPFNTHKFLESCVILAYGSLSFKQKIVIFTYETQNKF